MTTTRTLSQQSFDIIEDDDIIDDLDDELTESYETKRAQINSLIKTMKSPDYVDKKTQNEIRALTRHLDKLNDAQRRNVNFVEFKNANIVAYSRDKNVSTTLKNLYK
jgi:hypothetical protein